MCYIPKQITETTSKILFSKNILIFKLIKEIFPSREKKKKKLKKQNLISI